MRAALLPGGYAELSVTYGKELLGAASCQPEDRM